MVKVFVNDVNEYPGNVIAETFTESVVGATQEEGDEEEGGDGASSAEGKKYVVAGTIWDDRPDVYDDRDTFPVPKNVAVVPKTSPEQLTKAWLQHDVIIYSIMDSERQMREAEEAIQALHSNIDAIQKKITFICISSCMSWTKTKPTDPEEPDTPLNEDDYRRRKPHANYKEQTALEKLVVKLGKTDKSKLSTFVVAAGLLYGRGERVFHQLFKDAWHGACELTTLGSGNGRLPTIHITDLCSLLRNLSEKADIRLNYLVAVDDGQHTQKEIIKAISDAMGTGKVETGLKELAVLSRLMSQLDLDHLTMNVSIESVAMKEAMNIDWVAESGMIENIELVVKEFRDARKLIPVRVTLFGPPGAGKSTFAEKLSKEYDVPHLHMAQVIEENMRALRKSVARIGQEDLEEEEETQAQDDKAMLGEIEEVLEENGGRYSEEHLLMFWRKTLTGPACRNQGFIMDGFCKTTDQAKALYDQEEEDAEEDEDGIGVNKKLIPDVVIVLEASNDFLKDRVMEMPEQEVVKRSHYTEEKFTAKLEEYRAQNTDDVTVVNYFDEREIHPTTINVDVETGQDTFEPFLEKMRKAIGPPRNYGENAGSRRTRLKREKAAEEKRAQREEEERQRQVQADLREVRDAQAQWSRKYHELKLQEEEALVERTAPMRDYLVKHVMPTLTAGLTECMKIRPEDPVDFLAEFLFKHNPEPDE